MTDLEQRAHDLALATTMQIQKAKLNSKIASASSESNEIVLDVKESIDLYCNCYNAIAQELAKHLSKK